MGLLRKKPSVELVLKFFGRLCSEIYDGIAKADGRAALLILGSAAYRLGLDLGLMIEKAEETGVWKVARTVERACQLFGVKAEARVVSEDCIVLHCIECPWEGELRAPVCAAIGQMWKGVARSVDPAVSLKVLRTCGRGESPP